jgi:LemA protein
LAAGLSVVVRLAVAPLVVVHSGAEAALAAGVAAPVGEAFALVLRRKEVNTMTMHLASQRRKQNWNRKSDRTGKTAAVLLGCLGILVLLAVVAVAVFISGYNKAVMLDEQVKSSWAQVENQLQRRYDLIPNVVETVKGVAKQEEKIFLGIAEARKAYFQAESIGEKAKAAGTLESALSRLLMLRENYPALRSNESFLKLQDQLEGTENRLAVERMRYNEAVKQLNVYTRKFLGRFFANYVGVEPAEYFEIEEEVRETPKVDFSE